ncbi:CPBP family intramembrane glutamic endopeptidase [Vibrio sonorensis]|uniref:CPBP family intramembrane glutamic endopeptidase n=1 Tax=Vibrio sonorensis TaxID=1004316 RepID=UPI001C307D8C|nr:CPBP family intramembrane glutamic endopeptidase [Vibrio sonorensis]
MIGFAVYWAYCLLAVLLLADKTALLKLFRFDIVSKKSWFYALACFVPLGGAIYVNFLPYIDSIRLMVLVLSAATALLNGFVEELYWRGLYLSEFKNNEKIGLWLATALFGIWHIALFTISDIAYGGFAPLVFGSAFMGLLWAYCSRKLNSISFPIAAHILVNFFAFTGLYIANGFVS